MRKRKMRVDVGAGWGFGVVTSFEWKALEPVPSPTSDEPTDK